MQKLELRNHLRDIKTVLNSEFFIDYFSMGKQTGKDIGNPLFTAMLQSKSGYDNLIIDKNKREIIHYFNNCKVYNTKTYSSLMSYIVKSKTDTPAFYLNGSVQSRDFFNFHKSILDAFNLIDGMLFQDENLRDSVQYDSFEEAEKNGFVTFEIMSDETVLFQDFTIIVDNINALVRSLIGFYNRVDEDSFNEPKLILADSGSKINLSIKLPEPIAKAIAQIMNEGWLRITNGAAYKLSKIDNAFEKSLSISKKIDKAVENGLYTKEEASVLKNEIAGKVEVILLKNTLHKSKAEVIQKISHSYYLDTIDYEKAIGIENPPKELGEKSEENEDE